MKKQIKQRLYSVLAIATIINLCACGDDDSFDVTGSAASLAYLHVNGYVSANGELQNVIPFEAIQTPAGNFGNIKVKFPVKVNKATDNVTVTAAVDNTVVEAYNTRYKTSYLPLPDGLLAAEKGSVTINPGAYLSADSLTFAMDNSKVSQLEPGKEYLTSVKLQSATGDAQLSKTHNLAYVKIGVSYEAVKKNAGSDAMLGTLIENYAGWTYTSDHTTGAIENLWDEDGESMIMFTEDPSCIVFDMNAVKKITGIRALSPYAEYGSDYRFNNIALSVSKDNASWQDIGSLSNKEMKAEDGKQFICLYGPVEAQYMKLELTFSPYIWVKGLVELRVYAE